MATKSKAVLPVGTHDSDDEFVDSKEYEEWPFVDTKQIPNKKGKPVTLIGRVLAPRLTAEIKKDALDEGYDLSLIRYTDKKLLTVDKKTKEGQSEHSWKIDPTIYQDYLHDYGLYANYQARSPLSKKDIERIQSIQKWLESVILKTKEGFSVKYKGNWDAEGLVNQFIVSKLNNMYETSFDEISLAPHKTSFDKISLEPSVQDQVIHEVISRMLNWHWYIASAVQNTWATLPHEKMLYEKFNGYFPLKGNIWDKGSKFNIFFTNLKSMENWETILTKAFVSILFDRPETFKALKENIFNKANYISRFKSNNKKKANLEIAFVKQILLGNPNNYAALSKALQEEAPGMFDPDFLVV